MRKVLIGGAAVLGLMVAVSACHPVEWRDHHHHDGMMAFGSDDGWMSGDRTALKTLTALTCPETEGDLTRTAQAADGKSCDYSGRNDETVKLTLTPLNGGTAQAALAPVETELKALMPPPKDSAVNVETSKSGDGHDRAKVDMPFFHVDADGDKADVKIFGTTIHANGNKADIHTDMGLKNTTIHAGDGGAEIRSDNVGTNNAHLVYILAGDSAGPDGYHAVGYIAAGPLAGPLVVAEFRSKSEHHHGSTDHGDIGQLMKANLQP